MSSLGDVYLKSLQKRYGYPKGWMANWPPDFSQRLGVIGSISGGKINRDALLKDKGIHARKDPNRGGVAGPWNFQSDKSIKVSIGLDASTPGWEWIGSAKGGVKVGFGRAGGAVLGIGSSHLEGLLDIDGLKDELLKAAKTNKIAFGQAIVVEQQVADSGLLLVAEADNAELTAKVSADIGPTGIQSLASVAGSLNLQDQSHSVAVNAFPKGFTVAFRVLKLGTHGFWWWKRIVVKAAAVTEMDEESQLADSDYFAVL
jgi:hypothetical protein